MKKRILSVLLCLVMVLSLLPGTALAADLSVTVGNTTLSSIGAYSIAYATTNENGIVTTDGATADNYNVKFENGVLTLKDAVIAGAVGTYDNNYGIEASGNLIVILEGHNTVTGGTSTQHSYGICASEGKLTIRGDGSLSVSSGATSGQVGTHSFALSADNGVTIESGSITAMGGAGAYDSCGIESGSGAATITGGTVTAVGGKAKNSYGIYANGVAISGSAYVTAAAGRATDRLGESTGADDRGGAFTVGENATLIAVGGAAEAEGGKSRGIRNQGAYNTVVSDNARLVAIGGTGSDTSEGCSYGVEGLTYNGGLVVAKSGDATTSSAMCGAANGSAITNNLLAGTNDNTRKYLVFGSSAIYHAYTENIDSSDTGKDGITWSGNDLTLDNTIIIGADDERDGSVALKMAQSGTLTLNRFNVILSGNGIYATYALENSDSLTIDGTGSLVAVGGYGGTSGNPCGSISVNGALTQNGGSLTTIGGYWSGGDAFGIKVGNGVAVSSGNGVAVGGNDSGSAFFILDGGTPTGAVLLGGTWNGRAAVWQAASVNAVTPVITIDLSTAQVTYKAGDTATALNATATVTDNGEVTYDWYSNTTASTTGGTKLNITTATFTPPTTAVGTTYYYCVVKNTIADNGDGGTKTATTTTNAAHIVVNKADGPEAPTVTGGYAVSTANAEKFTYTVAAIDGAQYQMDGTDENSWQDSNVFDGLAPMSDHTFYARIKETTTHEAGAAGNTGSVRLKRLDNTVSPALNYEVTGESGNRTITITEVDGAEYKFGAGDYGDTRVMDNINDATVDIAIRYAATATRNASTPVTASVNTAKTAQSISFANQTVNKTYGDADFTITATRNTGDGAITYASSGDVAVVNTTTGQVLIRKQGTVTITATAAESETYAQATASYTLNIAKGTITITAKNKTAYVGDTAPDLSNPVKGTDYTITGLRTGEELIGALIMSCSPTMSAAGSYPITISGPETQDANYNNISYNNATLTVNTRPSTGGDYTPPLVTEIKSDGSVTGSNLDRLISGNKELTVTGDDGAKLVLSTDALKGINAQTSGSVKVEIKDVSGEHQDTHAGKPVFSLTVTSSGKTVSDFGGSVTVSLPYALKDGEKAENVAVWYLAVDGTMTEIPCTYDAKTKLATFTVTHFSEYVVGVKDWINPFADVKETDWFYSDVSFAHAAGMMNGTSGTTFDPHGTTTRGMLVTILYRLEGSPDMENENLGYPFADVDAEAYYGTAVYWARLNHIVDGYDTEHFGPNDSITREQLATILYRYAQYKGYETSAAMGMAGFSDASDVSSYAVSALQWACGTGLIQGSDGKLMPQGNAERCQVAAILHRFCENIVK